MKPALLIEYEEIAATAVVLMNEENRHLRTTGTVPDDAFLRRKRLLLRDLDENLVRLRNAGGREAGWPSDALTDLQQRFLQIARLDRENEKLLLAALSNPRIAEPELSEESNDPTALQESVRNPSGGDPAKPGKLRRIAKFLSQ